MARSTTTAQVTSTRPATCGAYVTTHAADPKFAAKIASRDVTCGRLPMHSGDCRPTLKAVAAPKAPKAPKAPSAKQIAAREAFAAAAKARHEAAVAAKAAKAPVAEPKAQPKAAAKAKAPVTSAKANAAKARQDAKSRLAVLVAAGMISADDALAIAAQF